MISTLYAIRDTKGDFWQPRIEQNEASAVRSFSMLVNAGEGVVSFSPQDFALYELGSYNSSNGAISPNDMPVFIIGGESLVGVRDAK